MAFDPIGFKFPKVKVSDGGAGYAEPGKVVFETELTPQGETSVTGGYTVATGNELKAGKTYTVTTDSGSFSAVCKETTVGYILGNAALFGLDDTGEEFVVGMTFENDDWVLGGYDFNGGTHMKVSTTETIHPIDPKYLPISSGAGLSIVKLSTLPNWGESTTLTEAEGQAMSAAWKSGTPFYIDLCLPNAMGYKFSPVEMYFAGEPFVGYMWNLFLDGAVITVSISTEDDGATWTIETTSASLT